MENGFELLKKGEFHHAAEAFELMRKDDPHSFSILLGKILAHAHVKEVSDLRDVRCYGSIVEEKQIKAALQSAIADAEEEKKGYFITLEKAFDAIFRYKQEKKEQKNIQLQRLDRRNQLNATTSEKTQYVEKIKKEVIPEYHWYGKTVGELGEKFALGILASVVLGMIAALFLYQIDWFQEEFSRIAIAFLICFALAVVIICGSLLRPLVQELKGMNSDIKTRKKQIQTMTNEISDHHENAEQIIREIEALLDQLKEY